MTKASRMIAATPPTSRRQLARQPSPGGRAGFTLHAGVTLRAGFTLNELLVVMGLIILIMALALPAFNLISGSRSIESAENRVSSYLGIVRAEAIGLGEPRGAILFEDENTRQVTLAQVSFPPGQTGTPLRIDLFKGRDEMSLPYGVGLQGIPNTIGAAYPWQCYALILFDGEGRLVRDRFVIGTGSDLDKRLPKSGPNAVKASTNTAIAPTTSVPGDPTPGVPPNIGFILFDKPTYEAQIGGAAATWLRDNAVPYLVNRYNGTLIKGE